MLASGLLIGLFALAAVQDAPPAENPYPVREILAAFATACSGIENLAVAKASVIAAGWQAMPADDKGALRQLVDYGKAKLAESDAEAKLLDGGEYRMTVAGRDLSLALSGVDLGEMQSHGCRVYDFAAPAPISAEDLEGWAARKPGSSTDPLPGFTKNVWNPGLKPGHMEMEVSYAAPGALAATGIPLTGLVLTATSVEFRKK